MTAPDDPRDDAADDLPEQLRIRRAKYDRLVADPHSGVFPVVVGRTNSLAQVRAAFPELAVDTATGREVEHHLPNGKPFGS